jgi:hypothetical protein
MKGAKNLHTLREKLNKANVKKIDKKYYIYLFKIKKY